MSPLFLRFRPLASFFLSLGLGLLVFILALPPTAVAQQAAPPFFAKVKGVTERNSLVVVDEQGNARQVVLAFLSIPFGDQPYSTRARAVLQAQLTDRRVSVRPIGEPHEGYVLGLVYVGDENFNLDFLSRGHSWLDPMQVANPTWLTVQQRARSDGRGLYADPRAIHPQQWQSEEKTVSLVSRALDSVNEQQSVSSRIRSTFVGHRTRREFVPFSCVASWKQWPQRELVPLLTVAGAEDSGFKRINCPTDK